MEPVRKEILESISSDLLKLKIFIQNSEWLLIRFMIEKGVWSGSTTPSPPTGFEPDNGAVEFGLAAYWLTHPDQLNFDWELKLEIRAAVDLWYYSDKSSFPNTQMTQINYSYINSAQNHLVYPDGSVLTAESYATFDQNWFLAFLNLVETTFRFAWKYGFNYPKVTATPLPIKGEQTSVRIAILGDWGTGDSTSKEVMEQLKSLKPHYIVHLGDVYYSGTPNKDSKYGKHYFLPGEESSNLLDQWPTQFVGKSFTLNSNHEMYSGANGYFDEALKMGGPFKAQVGQGCFVLKYGDWHLLGLDSAYMGSIRNLFMQGTLGSEDGSQVQWIKSLNLNPKKTIVFTHHNGFADDCASSNPLWMGVRNALGADPYAWYWGHVHNGIVYKNPIDIPATTKEPALKSTCYARCVGHAAIPYGNATTLENKPIEWRQKNINHTNNQLYNGFAQLELTLDSTGQVDSINEKFFDTSPASQPVFMKRIL